MSLWGPLAERYETRRPRKLLALDGGGIRGVLSLEILAEIERQLKELTGAGDSFRLCDFFDYIAGTSTGAIIAACLARGMSISQVLSFYTEAGPKMFGREWLLHRWKNLYKSRPLADQLRETFGEETTLAPEDLRCLLLVVLRNRTTDSPWPVSSNPLARYNDPARPDCNLRIPLWKIVRASTAAPVYFPPEVVEWEEGNPEKSFVFVDGGVSPYNNPSFLLYRMATLEPYRLRWQPGEREMMIVSVGTGACARLEPSLEGEANLLENVSTLPGVLMYGVAVDQDATCRTVGRCLWGAPLDREIGDLIPRDGKGNLIPLEEDLGRAFLYARYNADLSEEGLARLECGDIDGARVRRLDAVDAIDDLRRIGRQVAREVSMRDFTPFLGAS